MFLGFTDFDLANVLFRPGAFDDDPSKPYWPVGYFDPSDPPVRNLSWDQLCVEHWVVHGGLTLEQAERKLEESGFAKSYVGPALTPEE